MEIKHYGKQHTKVIFLIGGWTYKQMLLWLPAKILARHSYYCITYTYPNDTFSPNYQKTVTDLLSIKQDILQRIKHLKSKGFGPFHIYGTSLGSILATLVANESSDISKVILNTTGADTAETVWSWEKINSYFKKDLKEQGLTLEQLRNYWKPISPAYNMNNFDKKKILIYLSSKDQIIPYSQGIKVVAICKQKHYRYRLVINKKLSHRLAGIYNLLNAAVYLKFLEE